MGYYKKVGNRFVLIQSPRERFMSNMRNRLRAFKSRRRTKSFRVRYGTSLSKARRLMRKYG